MKKMNKETQFSVLIISSFLIGCIIGAIIMCIALPKEKNSYLTNTMKRVEGSVVTVESMNGYAVKSTGTGFIYKKSLTKSYVLTNEHVLDGDSVEITNANNETTTGIILGRDKRLDIAVIEIDSKYAPRVASLGDSDKIEVGEEIFVIGSPVSKEYRGTVTKGIISGKNRVVPSQEEEDKYLYGGIQFDATINPGSSGSPLFNEQGEVIGICIMKFIKTEIEGMSFAIPINHVRTNLKALEQGEEITTPELGITMVEVTNTKELNNYGITINNNNIPYGVAILEVKENSNADKKLKIGDVITQIDEKKIEETEDVKDALLQHSVGENISIKVIRNNKEKTIKISLK